MSACSSEDRLTDGERAPGRPVASGQVARITPGGPEDIGRLNFAITRLIGALTGGGPPNIFTTLARHRGVFRKWLRFASALMPGGVLPRIDSELLILRVAHNCSCDYEWQHHQRLGQLAGLSAEEIERVGRGPSAEGWSPRRTLLLGAADALHVESTLPDELWRPLRAMLSDAELIEMCLLVGHYEMLAMTANALRIQPDLLPPGPPSRSMRALQSITNRRQTQEPRQ
jgi:alkylhydroperoxidase family enzyme